MNGAARLIVAVASAAVLVVVPVQLSAAQTGTDEVPPQRVPSGADAAPPQFVQVLEPSLDTPEETAAYEQAAMARADLLGPYFDELSVLPGFESGGLADDSDDLEFYWHGALPAEAEAIVQRAEDEGRTVRIVHVPYSHDEVWEYSLALVGAIDEDTASVSGFGPNRSRTAIELLGPGLGEDTDAQHAIRAIADGLLPNDLEIVFVSDAGFGITYDSEPFEGGPWVP